MDTILLCLGCFIAGLGVGGLLGMLVTRTDDRPAVTPWGESTALWAEHDWDWWHRCGKHSEPDWAGRQRRTFPEVDPAQIGKAFVHYDGGGTFVGTTSEAVEWGANRLRGTHPDA